MDIATMANMFSPDMLDSVGDMLQLAMACCDIPPKAIAAEIGYSVDSIYAAANGVKKIPNRARQQLSNLNLIAAAAVAMEATGFKRLFGYQKVDRHIQSMILRLKMRDKETDKILEALPAVLLDKNSRDDLTADEVDWLQQASCMLADLTNSHINLIMELEARYRLGITTYLQDNKKSPAA